MHAERGPGKPETAVKSRLYTDDDHLDIALLIDGVMNTDSTADLQRQRVVRVFVSSTFRDMQAERDELAKRIFPQLRKLCEQRGVVWGEVDLRWGITEEQTERGEALPICLEEIERTRPYFIGLLGERYGWVPDEIDGNLLKQQPWLMEHLESSVTELEMLHGVLNNPDMAGVSFFYLRDPAYLDSLNFAERSAYTETPTVEKLTQLGTVEAEGQFTKRRKKLLALKERIRTSGLPVRLNYPNPESLGQMVLQDLTRAICERFPEGQPLDPLDRDANEHDAFASSRADVYIERQAYFDRLDAHVAGDDPPLVVLGKSGSGKSALLARWALRYRQMQLPEARGGSPLAVAPIIVHFVGATSASTDWAAMVRRVIGELCRKFDLPVEIPDKPDDLRLAFATMLSSAAARGRFVLILDGLNQLEDRDGAPDLVWLPREFPANVRLILATLPGRPLDEIQKRGWPTLQVEPLSFDERQTLIREYLRHYSKELAPELERRVASAEQTASPLFLRAMIEELRLYGDYKTLTQRIDHYLQAASAGALYARILERYEQDYERDRPRLVRDTMILIWASRRGLTETELLELLGKHGEPLPRAYFSPLYLAAESSLLVRSGYLGFGHEHLRQAVQMRYLSNEREQRNAHLRLAGYFHRQKLGPRKIDELPWHWSKAGASKALYKLLADVSFFWAAWTYNEDDVKSYWADLRDVAGLHPTDAYAGLLRTVDRLGDAAERRQHGDVPPEGEVRLDAEQALATSCVASLLNALGYLNESMAFWNSFARLSQVFGDKDPTAATVGRLALAMSLGPQAEVLRSQGDLDGAMALYKEVERISRETGDRATLANALGGQAAVFTLRGELDEAMSRCIEQERLHRESSNRSGLAQSLGHRGNILLRRGDYATALTVFRDQERLYREIESKTGIAMSLGSQGIAVFDQGDLDTAMALFKEQEQLSREIGDKEQLQVGMRNQANILLARGDQDGALALYIEEGRLSRELRDTKSFQLSLGSQAGIHYAKGDLDGAMDLYRAQEDLCRELGDKGGLQISLARQIRVLRAQGELNDAMDLCRERESICRAIGDLVALQDCLSGQADILYSQGQLSGALDRYEEEEAVCWRLKDKSRLQTILGNKGVILAAQGRAGDAMRQFKEQEAVSRETGNPDGIATSLTNQAVGLFNQGEKAQALRLVEEAARLADVHGLVDLSNRIRPVLQGIRSQMQ